MTQRTLYLATLAALATPFNLAAQADAIEEMVVSARHDTRTIDVTEALRISPDVARLLEEAPGAHVNSNGPITGIPQYRGMYGPRIATSLNGNQLAPAGPNWMDPPISYAVTAQLESLTVYRGIAPVSVAQESIGGAIDARTRRGEFGSSREFQLRGRLVGSAQSVNNGYQLDADLYASNNQHRFKLAAMTQAGDDAEFPSGEILPSEYERQRYDVGYGFRAGNHSIQLDYGYNDTGEAGTPALPMDIDYFEGDLYDLTYLFDLPDQLEVVASVYGSELEHGMTNFHLRQPPEPSRWRQNIATSDNLGFNLRTTQYDADGAWTFGFDGFSAEHDSDIDNPKNPMFFVVNFNGAEREVLGVFLEREHDFNQRWSGEFGLRYNQVTTDAGEVDATTANMMPPATRLRDAFNDADREQRDHNIDLVARGRYRLSDRASWFAGAAQKTRSPSYQERYLWLPLEATAGLADGQLYVGDIDLDPEVSRVVEFGLDYADGRFSLSPRIYYNLVDDYIQGTPLGAMHPATMLVRMMNMMNGTNRPDPLQFSNVDAKLYGFDMDWAWRLDQHWSLSGVVNYVRGKRRDIDDELYRIAPTNATFRLNYAASNWSATLENALYSAQNQVSDTNREQETAGYGIVNINGTWQVTPQLQLAAGVDNLFDKEYFDHLGGYNRAANPNIDRGSRLPGYGTNLFARVLYTF
jgi:iron complex outermembrane receptor protein